MRNWAIATLLAIIILTSPFTIIGTSIVGGVIFHGPGFMDAAKMVAESFYWEDDPPTHDGR